MTEMNFTVNIRCPELAAAIDNLAAALSSAGNNMPDTQQSVNPPATNFNRVQAGSQQINDSQTFTCLPTAVPAVSAAQPQVQPVVPAITQPQVQPVVPAITQQQAPIPASMPVASPVPTNQTSVPTTIPTYTIEQFQIAIAPILDAGRAAEVRQVVRNFGVNTLMEIPKERYGELANAIRALGGVI